MLLPNVCRFEFHPGTAVLVVSGVNGYCSAPERKEELGDVGKVAIIGPRLTGQTTLLRSELVLLMHCGERKNQNR